MDRVAFTRNTLRDFVSHLRFRVTDNDIITGKQKAVGDFSFCAEGLTGTRRTQNQAVGVFQQLSVHHDEVLDRALMP